MTDGGQTHSVTDVANLFGPATEMAGRFVSNYSGYIYISNLHITLLHVDLKSFSAVCHRYRWVFNVSSERFALLASQPNEQREHTPVVSFTPGGHILRVKAVSYPCPHSQVLQIITYTTLCLLIKAPNGCNKYILMMSTNLQFLQLYHFGHLSLLMYHFLQSHWSCSTSELLRDHGLYRTAPPDGRTDELQASRNNTGNGRRAIFSFEGPKLNLNRGPTLFLRCKTLLRSHFP